MVNENNQVIAVVDWEMMGRLPPVFELIRTLSYVRLLQPELLSSYLSGYRSLVHLSFEECRLGVEMWFQSLIHDTWAFTCRFIDQDKRTERFFLGVQQRLLTFADPQYRQELSTTLGRSFSSWTAR